MLLHALSIGGEVDVWTAGSGVVHSVFDRAINLLVAGELWTVLTAVGHDCPFGIRVAVDDRHAGFNVGVADRVHIRASCVSIGKLIIDCRTASRWMPSQWAAPAAGLEARLAAVETAARQRAWSGSAGMADAIATALLRQPGSNSERELIASIRQTVGRGPGLTPSGDDVLVGILTVLVSGAAGAAGLCCAARLRCMLDTLLPSTTDISRHLLDQAARGLPGRALHELGKALVEGAPDNHLRGSLGRVLDTGATSGADACMGLTTAIHHLFPPAERIAA